MQTPIIQAIRLGLAGFQIGYFLYVRRYPSAPKGHKGDSPITLADKNSQNMKQTKYTELRVVAVRL